MNDPRLDEPKDGDELSSAPVEPDRESPSAAADAAAGDDRSAPAEPEQAGGQQPESGRPPATTGRSLGVALGMFALLVAFAAAGGVAFTWWLVAEQREADAVQRADAADRLAEVRELVAGTEQRLAVQEQRLGTIDREVEQRQRRLESIDEQLGQARARLEALAQEDAGPERPPSLAELEFLLLLAGRELTLGDNPRTALAALREADKRVARLDDPGLGAVRSAINDEIAAVEAVADIDLGGIALRLGSLARRVEGLPLRASLTPAPGIDPAAAEESTGWRRLWQRIQAAGGSLFRIRRTDAPAAPLLAPDESFFLYRNVELDLKSARLAVLARDPQNYLASLESARRSLQEYFETSDDAVRSLLEAIEDLEGREIAPEWPEISRSLALLRNAGASR